MAVEISAAAQAAREQAARNPANQALLDLLASPDGGVSLATLAIYATTRPAHAEGIFVSDEVSPQCVAGNSAFSEARDLTPTQGRTLDRLWKNAWCKVATVSPSPGPGRRKQQQSAKEPRQD